MYKAVYSEDALRQILALRPATKRQYVLSRIEALAQNAFMRGESLLTDDIGRENHIRVLSGLAITYWPDHPVKEVRIVSIVSFSR